MNFDFSRSAYPDPEFYFFREWIETNGYGGWASATLTGTNFRRYHGLFISGPMSQRMVLLSKMDESIYFESESYQLGTNRYKDSIYPNGYQYLDQFSKDLFPSWIYKFGSFTLKKSIAGLALENAILICYEVLDAPGPFEMVLTPLVAARGYHALSKANSQIRNEANLVDNVWSYQAYGPETHFEIQTNAHLNYIPRPEWYYNFFYPAEQERGQDCEEDLFSPGLLKTQMVKGGKYYFLISENNETASMMEDLWNAERDRRNSLLKNSAIDDLSRTLILASDQFIVKTEENLNSVIAGYHWFLDWGRDTMISLPGLCISTHRTLEAKRILQTFANNIYQGIIPNRFSDHNGKPEYNTADATLWFFVACYRYYLATEDPEILNGSWIGIFQSIMDWHLRGTIYNIHADHDGLLYQGEGGTQLTWMDAKVGDWVVTPRTGKVVEINALWYNAHQIFSFFLMKSGDSEKAEYYKNGAANLQSVFISKFWNENGSYLYDVLDNDFKDAKFRPNQLFAISLPFPVVNYEQARSILNQVREKLYTPKGLRSLSPDDPEYCSYYTGDQYNRDKAYHQGTVWSWLLGPYIDALMRIEGNINGRLEAKQVIQDFIPHFQEAGIGTVSEIFDAEPPFYPKGCIAQAWGVGEILRVYMGYKLYE